MSDGMMSSIEKLPPWAIPATAVVVVGLLLLRNGQSSNGTYGVVQAYAPAASDPGLDAVMTAEIQAKSSAFNAVVGAMGAEDISRLSAQRDIAISNLQAESDAARVNAAMETENLKTRVAQTLGLAQTDAARVLGLAQTDASLKLGITQARTSAEISADNNATQRYGLDIGSEVANFATATAASTALSKLSADAQAQAAATAAQLQEAKWNKDLQQKKNTQDFWGNIYSHTVGAVLSFFGI